MSKTAKNCVTRSSLLRAPSVGYSQVGKVSSQSVEKHTGKGWEKWIDLLKRAGAEAWTYQEIVAYLRSKHRLTPWWQQGVAQGFEIATGRRGIGQDAKGKYMVTATKSLPQDVREVWSALLSGKGQAIWLQPFSAIEIGPKTQFETQDGFFGEIRTVLKQRRIRMYWQDPLWQKHTVVELLLVPKPRGKSLLVFNHTGIAEAKTKELLRARWRKAADEIAQFIA